jgi:hypothetical protein
MMAGQTVNAIKILPPLPPLSLICAHVSNKTKSLSASDIAGGGGATNHVRDGGTSHIAPPDMNSHIKKYEWQNV